MQFRYCINFNSSCWLVGVYCISLVGILGVSFTSHILHTTDNWALVFLVIAAIVTFGFIVYMLFGSGKRLAHIDSWSMHATTFLCFIYYFSPFYFFEIINDVKYLFFIVGICKLNLMEYGGLVGTWVRDETQGVGVNSTIRPPTILLVIVFYVLDHESFFRYNLFHFTFRSVDLQTAKFKFEQFPKLKRNITYLNSKIHC